jgi:hypothetical protein
VPFSAAGILNWALNSPMYRSRRKALAPSTVVIPARRSSCGNRPCQVRSCVPNVPAPAGNTPQSSALRTLSLPVPPASGDACPPFPFLHRHEKVASPSYQRWSFSQRCLLPSICSSIPGSGRRGGLRRCGSACAVWHQPGSLLSFLHPGVAHLDGMFVRQLFVKVPDIPVSRSRFPDTGRAPSRFVANGMRWALGFLLRRSASPASSDPSRR